MRCICMRMQFKIEARFQIKSFTPEKQLKYTMQEMAFWVAFDVYSNNNKENE